MVVDVPTAEWNDLKESMKEDILENKYTQLQRDVYIVQSLGVIQSSSGIQIAVFAQLDYPLGHRIMTLDNERNINLVEVLEELDPNEILTHKIIHSTETDRLMIRTLQLLKNIYNPRDKKKVHAPRQKVHMNFGINGGQSHSRFCTAFSMIKRDNRKRIRSLCKEKNEEVTAPLGISIPLNNVEEGVNPLVDSIFRHFTELIKINCPWLWKGRADERIASFSGKMIKETR